MQHRTGKVTQRSTGRGATRSMLAVMSLAVVLVVQLLASILAVGSAAADVYPPGSALTVATDKQTYASGETVTISATACTVGETVTFRITSPNGSTVVLTGITVAAGDQSVATVTLEADQTGAYTVVATCEKSSATTGFNVFKLPVTGSNVARPIVYGAIVLVIGVGMVIVGRGRRRPLP